MPGIVGLMSHQPQVDFSEELEQMLACLRHYDWYRNESVSVPEIGLAAGRVTLGHRPNAAQPVASRDGTWQGFVEGELYNVSELAQELAGQVHPVPTDGSQVLVEGFAQKGAKFLEQVNGLYIACLWHRQSRRLVLITDRFGMKPLYYTHSPGCFLFGSSIRALRVDPALDGTLSARGVAQFFIFGHFFNEDTFFQEIRVVPAASCLVYDACNDRVTIERYWHLQPAERTLADQAALETLCERFARAVLRRVGDGARLGLSLSGGLDARTILGVASRYQVPLITVCLGMDGSLDHASARRMARIAGCPHHSHILDTHFLGQYGEHLRDMVRLTDGHYLCQCIVMPTLPLYRRLGIEALLRGHAGELLHMDKAYNYSLDAEAFWLASEEALTNWLLRRLRAYIYEPRLELFRQWSAAEIEAEARDSLRQALAPTQAWPSAAQRIAHVFLTQRLRRETALSLVEFQSLVEVRLPYLDNDFIAAVFATPPELKRGDRIQAFILQRFRPEFLEIVNANTGTVLGAGRLRRTLARIKLKVLAKLGVKGYQPYERLGLWLRRELRPLVEGMLLGERCLDRGIFEPDAVRRVVHDHMENKRNHTYLLLALLIFEQAQRELWGREAVPSC